MGFAVQAEFSSQVGAGTYRRVVPESAMIPMRYFALGETILKAISRPYGVSFLRRISIMIDDSMDSQILTHEQHAIELLARETHTSLAKVQEIFLVEHAKLAVGARIQSYVPVLTGNRVRVILDERNAAKDNEGHLADA